MLKNHEFTPTDLPEPVVPATSTCGIFAKSATMLHQQYLALEQPWSVTFAFWN
ncbi:hypothetical protein [Vibrio vulnificus]|uniref:hypothetical protein n=1 Tax=Vibrio vulnificus TaxID=672 RepID=UPI00374E1E48